MIDLKKKGYKRLPIDRLIPHPDNPRKDLGDLSELTESIRASGIYQNLTVTPAELVDGVTIPDDSHQYYVVVIGHRRLAAAKAAGLTEVPCMDVNMDRKEQLSTMLLENMQRSDLTVYEQAMGFEQLRLVGCTVDEISEKSGFSASTVRRRLRIAELDPGKLHTVAHDEGRQLTLEDFDRLAKVEDMNERNNVLLTIGTRDFDAALNRALIAQEVKRNRPEIDAWLSAHNAKQITRSESWSGRYETLRTSGGYWSSITMDKLGQNGNKLPPETFVKDHKELFYTMDDRMLTLYTKTARSSGPKKSREELEREKVAREAKADIARIAGEHYELRSGFISRANFGKTDYDAIMNGAAMLLFYYATSWGSSGHIDPVNKSLGLANYEMHTDKVIDAINQVACGKDYGRLARTVYYCFNDSERETFAQYMQATGTIPVYESSHNTKLTILYRWLELLGYEPCDEERQMIDGTHEAYHRKVKKAKGKEADNGKED